MPRNDFSPTANEQLLLEMTNRARLSPGEEFGRFIVNAASSTAVQANITNAMGYFGVDVAALRSQLAVFPAVAPLAWNSLLAQAAYGHSQAMIDADMQAHQLPGQLSFGSRVRETGYVFRSIKENVYAWSEDILYGHAGFMIDWGYDDIDIRNGSLVAGWDSLGDGIQDGAGHRAAILSADVTEVGMAVILDTDPSTDVGPQVITQDFGAPRAFQAQLLGVVINDADGDRFYDIGEGLAGVTITATGTAGTFTTQSWAAGGYQMVLPAGNYMVTFSGAGLAGYVQHSITMQSANLKLDGIAADATVFLTQNGSWRDEVLNGGAGKDVLNGLAGNDTLYGGDGTDTLSGGLGDDWLYGGATTGDLRDVMFGGDGNDYMDGGYGNDELRGNTGHDTLIGGFGADTLIGDDGNDVLSGAALGDLLFGGDGDDFINGGFGHDRLNGGAGADAFYHLGIRHHGSDWIQDYTAADGDVLVFGGPANTSPDDFMIAMATTESAGSAEVQEIFVTQISTRTLLWALVDGAGQQEINIQIGGQLFDLLA